MTMNNPEYKNPALVCSWVPLGASVSKRCPGTADWRLMVWTGPGESIAYYCDSCLGPAVRDWADHAQAKAIAITKLI